MKIRKMTTGDIDAVIAIGSQSPELAVSDVSQFWSTKRLIPWVEADTDIMLVAEEGGEVIGAVLTQLHVPSAVGYLSDIVIKESARGKGVGTALLSEAIQQLDKLGVTLVYGLTQTNNTKVHQLLKKEGFNKGEELIWFEKRLK